MTKVSSECRIVDERTMRNWYNRLTEMLKSEVPYEEAVRTLNGKEMRSRGISIC